MPMGFKSDSFVNYDTEAIPKNYDVEEPDFKAKNVATDFSNKALYKILYSFLKHGNNSLIKVATRAMINRCMLHNFFKRLPLFLYLAHNFYSFLICGLFLFFFFLEKRKC